jgi:secondary thiamine-phosphate synthase enzyme
MKSTLHYMKSLTKFIQIPTERKQQMLDITATINEAVQSFDIQDGILAIYSQHTTAALLVSEPQEALIDDVQQFLNRVVDDRLPYKHNSPEFSDCERQNAASHLRGLLLSHSVVLPVAEGKPALGRFQSVLFAELDGPRQRTLRIQVLGL